MECGGFFVLEGFNVSQTRADALQGRLKSKVLGSPQPANAKHAQSSDPSRASSAGDLLRKLMTFPEQNLQLVQHLLSNTHPSILYSTCTYVYRAAQ